MGRTELRESRLKQEISLHGQWMDDHNLWGENSPAQFWRCYPEPPAEVWHTAILNAAPVLSLSSPVSCVEDLLHLVLGEAQFGRNHWELGKVKRFYYLVKPILGKGIINRVKKISSALPKNGFPLGWPVEDRYVKFQWEVIRQVLLLQSSSSLRFRKFWPGDSRFAFVLTHDIETSQGQKNAARIADLEEELGFRSSFNFVAERYALDQGLINDLRNRGFEIGVHGLKHDGKLFSSKSEFVRRAEKINQAFHDLGAVGFRSPLTHRNPEWMQFLNIEYDASFFDTDPYEPMPGGVMSIWPFQTGRFTELPYTLAQDVTLYHVLGERTPRLWLDKVRFIEKFMGMALAITHPDYLVEPELERIYVDFLRILCEGYGSPTSGKYWHALPRDVARWWVKRSGSDIESPGAKIELAEFVLQEDREAVMLYEREN
jgi:hypothetical protein